MNPRRVEGLEINTVEDGFMIYQPDRDRVHYLNHTAVLVLELSNGRHSAREIAQLVGKAYGLSKPPSKEVDEAIARMSDEGLLEFKPARAPRKRAPTRAARKTKR